MSSPGGVNDRLAVATRLSGTAVMDAHANEIGSLEDVVIDRARGRVAYALVTLHAQPDRWLPVPWLALAQASDGTLILDTPPGTLDWAPAYPRQQTPDWADEEWGKRLHAVYQARPYWDLP